MKLSSILIPATASLLLAGCNSLDNPVTNLFHGTGRDERVYNAQTGQWEWPADKRKPAEKKSAAVASALGSTPAPHGFNDTRYWDASRNQWVEAEQPRSSAPPKPKPTPVPSEPIVATTSQPAAPLPPPRPSQATGVYNPSTGKIDWQTSDANVPHGAVAPQPEPKKHWYWPF
jgi:hypothetical protein